MIPQAALQTPAIRAYSVAQFTATYGVGRATLYRLWDAHQGPARMRVGRRVLIPVEAAERWALAMTEGVGGTGVMCEG